MKLAPFTRGFLYAAIFLAGALTARTFWPADRSVAAGANPGSSPGDVNCDGSFDLTDPVLLLNHLFLGGPGPEACARPAPTGASTVIVVRHAEREPGGCEALLVDAGAERARLLACALAQTQVDALIASDCVRTELTLTPLRERKKTDEGLDLSISKIAAATDVVAEIERMPRGTVAVVAHHSFTIHDILTGLGLPDSVRDIPISGSRHDDLFVVERRNSEPPLLLHLKFPAFLSCP